MIVCSKTLLFKRDGLGGEWKHYLVGMCNDVNIMKPLYFVHRRRMSL